MLKIDEIKRFAWNIVAKNFNGSTGSLFIC